MANTPGTATPTSGASPTPTPGPTQPADYVASPLNAIPGWPNTANWQDGIIDGVYAGWYGVFLIRGGEYVELAVTGGDSMTMSVTSGPSAIGTLPAIPPNLLPGDWQATGFDTGFDVIGADAQPERTVITKGAQALVIDRTSSGSVHHALQRRRRGRLTRARTTRR